VSVGDRSERLIELVRQHELCFTAEAQERPSENMRTFLGDYWTPFYDHFVGLSEPDVSIRFLGLSNELSRLRAIAAYNGISTPDLDTAQHGYTTTQGEHPMSYGPTPTFVGRCYVGAPPAKYSLVNTVPVLAPGAGGMSVKLSIDGCHLVANVCIDGKCYKGAADLTGLVDFTSGVLDAALAHWHAKQHRSVDLAVPTPRGERFLDTRTAGWFGNFERGLKKDLKKAEHAVPGLKDVVDVAEDVEKYTTPEGLTLDVIEAARGGGRKKKGEKKHDVLHEHAQVIRATGEALVGAIAERHTNEFCAGWWHSLTHDIESGVKGIEHGLGGMLKKLKGPIVAAVSAVAQMYGVPPQITQQLAGGLIDAATGSGSVKAAAKQMIAQAAANPQLAPILAVAQKAVAQGTVAAQAAQTVADAAAGSPAAAQQIAQLASAATAGDPAAQQAMSLVQQLPGVGQQLQQIQPQIQQAAQQGAQAISQAAQAAGPLDPSQYGGDGSNGSSGSGDGSGDGSGGDTSSSGTADGPRARAVALAQGSPAKVVGVVCTADGQWSATPFATSDEADDWYGGWLGIPHAYLYVAYFDKAASWPYPENEQVARGAAARSAGTAVGVGPFMPILFTPIEAGLAAILAAGAGYHYGNTRSAGWPAIALAAGGGFAAGHWGERAYDWARNKWDAHEIAKAAKGAG
jgi:hypothetical protein